jgi:hypothetical protein
MDAALFVIKSAVVTAVLIVLMQVRFGDMTAEEHTIDFVTSSALVAPLEEVAQGAVKAMRDGWNKFSGTWNHNVKGVVDTENLPGYRQARLQIQRSKQFVTEKTDEVTGAVGEQVDGAREKFRKNFKIDETYVPGQKGAKSAKNADASSNDSSGDSDSQNESE